MLKVSMASVVLLFGLYYLSQVVRQIVLILNLAGF